MEHFLLLTAIAVALIATVWAAFMPGKRAESNDRQGLLPAEIAALILPLAGFLATLPSRAPFAAGQGLGVGFLLGGVAALAVAALLRRCRTDAAAAIALAIPTVTITLALLLLRATLIDSLLGIAIGDFAVTFLLVQAAGATTPRSNLLMGAGFAAALAGVAALGAFRDPRTPEIVKGLWSAVAVLFSATAALLSLVAASLRGASEGGRRVGFGAVVALGLAAVTGVVLGVKVIDDRRLIADLLIGLAAFPLLRFLRSADGAASARPYAASGPILALLTVVSVSMVGGQLLQGYGFGLALLALYAGWAAFGDPHDAPTVRLLLFGTALTLYRVFLARWGDDLRGVGVTDQYAVFGFVVGAAAPGLIANLLGGIRTGAARPCVASLLAGLFALALPASVVLLFGPKCALALLLGAAVAGAFSGELLPIVLVLGIALALDQWNGLLLPYADVSRLVKLRTLGVVLAVLLATLTAARARGDQNAGEGGMS
jgi:hypothetical protein